MKMSSFTALNGTSPPRGGECINGSIEKSMTSSEDATHNMDSQTHDQRPLPESSSPIQRDQSRWAAQIRDQTPYQGATYLDRESSHKRKRSDSIEPRRRERPLSFAERPEETGQQARTSESRDSYDSPRRDYRAYEDGVRERLDSWSSQAGRDDRVAPYEAFSAGPDSARTDDRYGDGSLRAGQLDCQNDYPQTSPDGDDRSTIYGGHYSPEQRRDGLIQSDPKKRKRNFSNRTKTGCLTCRKRKKKCDEAKPECSNCVRGGFVCAGYPPQRGNWPKPEAKPVTVQIESKDPTYVPPGAYGMPQHLPYGAPPIVHTQPKRESLPSYRGQPLRIEPPQGRLLQSDDDRATASTLPSASIADTDTKLSAISAYTNAANVFPTPVSAASAVPFSERTPKEYQRVPPVHEVGRGEGENRSHGPTLPQINILNATRSNSPNTHSQAQTTGAQATAQLALSHTAHSPVGPARRERTEMLGGRAFYPFDKELVLERERCSAACWRFNNSTNPNNGISPGERARLFREVLQPREGVQMTPTQTSPVTHAGHVGLDVVVEAPFTADYGYNIHIGKNVVIGRGASIVDACEVKIGDNVIMGNHVCIYTADMAKEWTHRQGSRSTQVAKPVVIEDDVLIGHNTIILPGVTIGRGTTVGAGSIVTKDLPKYSICHGQPCHFRRSIAST